MRSADLARTRRRLRVVQVLMVAALLGLLGRAAHLSLADARALARGEAQMGAALHLPGPRGEIVDREGALLAVTVGAPSVYVDPRAVTDPDATAAALARALGRDRQGLRRRLAGRRGFVFLARWIPESQAARVAGLGLAGVGIVREPRRRYPNGALAGALLGFANIDGEGVRGVEQMEERWLRGRPRRVGVERDARGRLLAGPGLATQESPGGDVALTLDAAMQADAEAALSQAVAATGARGGFVLALDPLHGDVLAVAEQPPFDPNRFRETPFRETRSRVFTDALEPGSTLKPFVVAAALEAGVVAPDEVIDLEGGRLRVPGKWIRDLHPHDALDPGAILRVSSNVGAVKIGQRLGPRREYEALRRFGFGAVTGSGFPEEAAGLLRSWKRWQPVDHATVSFGQGLNVTAIQMAAAMAALANDGLWTRPRLVAARRRPGAVWEPARPAPTRRVLSPEVARRVRAMMEGVVGPEGTGRRAGLRGLRVAGKTGTAQKLDPETGNYAEDRYLAWFAGIVPADAPRLVMIVALDEPQGAARTGGAVAAPVFARVAAGHLARGGLPTEPMAPLPAVREARVADSPADAAPEPAAPDRAVRAVAAAAVSAPPPPPARPAAARENVPARPAAAPAPRSAPASTRPAVPAAPEALPAGVELARIGDRVLLPDLRGLSVAQVRALVRGAPVDLQIVGRGRAVEQDPEPGAILVGDHARVRVRFAAGGGG